MNSKLKNALYILENTGHTVSRMNESSSKDLVKEIKEKLDEWDSIRDTPEGDVLWDDMYDTYGGELLELVNINYDRIVKGEPVDMTIYADKETSLKPKFFDLLKKIGVKEFKLDTRQAFYGESLYFYLTIVEGKVKLNTDKYDHHNPEYAFFTVKD